MGVVGGNPTDLRDRLSRWREPMFLPRWFSADPDAEDELPPGDMGNAKPWGIFRRDDDRFDMGAVYASARELIYDIVDGNEVVHFVCYSINRSTNQIEVAHFLDTVDATEDDIIGTLAYAYVYEIPVFPNVPAQLDRLIAHYKALFTHGFKWGMGKRTYSCDW